MLDTESIPDAQAPTAEQELLAAERHAALREAFTRLPRCCQQLIALLISDPPLSYAQISARLGIPVGASGHAAPVAWTNCAAIRRSPPCSTPTPHPWKPSGPGRQRYDDED